MKLTAIVTGHTKGIGQAIYSLLQQKEIQVFGVSRTNGFDLENDYESVKGFILEKDPDIFINNAYVQDNQTKLLKDIYNSWKLRKKIIINICSVASLLPDNHPDYNMSYPRDKREQREFCHEQNFNYSKTDFSHVKCGLINLNFDYVKTSFKSKYDKRLFPNLSSEETAGVIWYAIQAFQNNICFREMSFHSTKKPELSK